MGIVGDGLAVMRLWEDGSGSCCALWVVRVCVLGYCVEAEMERGTLVVTR